MQTAVDANSKMQAEPIALLQLLHLADSALPIGAIAHSFGLETLIAEAALGVSDLPLFFEEWLRGQGHVEAAFCLWAHAAGNEEEWHLLNLLMSSLRPARESRQASLRLGKRFLSLAQNLCDEPAMRLQVQGDVHLAAAFGKVGAALNIDAVLVVAAYLHQSIFGAISACQRLLPLGQTAAMRLLWSVKPGIHRAVQRATKAHRDDLWSTQPLLEIASMRHPRLATRLFIS